jgi:hypothetical protein
VRMTLTSMNAAYAADSYAPARLGA